MVSNLVLEALRQIGVFDLGIVVTHQEIRHIHHFVPADVGLENVLDVARDEDVQLIETLVARYCHFEFSIWKRFRESGYANIPLVLGRRYMTS